MLKDKRALNYQNSFFSPGYENNMPLQRHIIPTIPNVTGSHCSNFCECLSDCRNIQQHLCCCTTWSAIRITRPVNGGSSGPMDQITGMGTPYCSVALYIDGVYMACIPIDAGGNWNYQPTLPLSAGYHCVRAVLCCPCKNKKNLADDNVCFTVGEDPGIQITGPDDGGEADPGDPVTGTGEPGCEAELFIDGVSVGRVPIDQAGNWIYQPPVPWPGGRHCVRAVLRCPDSLDPEPPEDISCFNVPIPPCVAPNIDVPADLAIIPANQPSITGRGIPDSTVSVCLQDSMGTTLFCQNTHVYDDGEWGIQSPIMLPDGTYTVVATQLGINCTPADAYRTFSVFTVDTSFFAVNLVSLRRGQVFRTVDTVLTTDSAVPHTMNIYYLLLVPGLPIPTADEIVAYNDSSTLSIGDAVRGRFTVNIGAGLTTLPFSLTGKENIIPLMLETGVMDGFNYDIYVTVSIDGGLTLSGVLSVFESAIGMPFASGNGTLIDPFVVRMCTPAEMAFYPDLTAGNPGNRAGVTENARILDNIEGMQTLYDQTSSVHGMPDSLSLSYSFASAFDLANYVSAWSGNGWRPIGNIDSAFNGTPLSGLHIFSGVAKTAPGGTTINNLHISANGTVQDPVLVRGLFGQTQNVLLSGFILTNPIIAAMITGSASTILTGKIGSLAGYAVGGQISDITVNSVTIGAGRATSGSNTVYAGGMIGIGQALSSISNISLTQANLSEFTTQATVMGGLIGRLDQAGTSTILQNVQVAQSSVTSHQTLGGVIGEINNGISLFSNVTVGSVSLTHTGFRVGGIIGNLIANATSSLQNISVNNIQMGPANPPTTTGYAGGLIGQIVQTAPCIVQNSEVLGGTINSGGRVGGAFGSLNVGAAGFLISNVTTAANTFPNNGPAGGFIGRVDINTSLSAALLVDNCHVTASTLSVTSTNTSSAYVGGFVGYNSPLGGSSGATTPVLTFMDCSTTVTVSHPLGESTGGFVGSAALSRYLRCISRGNVTGRQNVGGFCGNGAGVTSIVDSNFATLQFVLCQARGNVNSTDTSVIANVATGGFGGSIAYALIDRCFATGNAAASIDDVVAGLVALSTHRLLIRDSYALGAASTTNNVAGGLAGSGTGSKIERCYATGSVSCNSGAGGLISSLVNDGAEVGSLAMSFALNPSVAATNPGGTAHRVCSSLGSGAQLVSNYALNTMSLTVGGVPVTPVDDPNGRDGQGTSQSNLLTLITALGWDTTNVWDTSTVATLGRPTLFENPES